jgi:virulence factor Mce-like protein
MRPAGTTRVDRTRAHERRVRRAGVGLILAAVAVVLLVFGGGLPFGLGDGDLRTVRAQFADASNVRTGQPVRIHGVDVGKVTGVRGEPGGHTALVTMRVEQGKAGLLHADARAVVWWRTLLGRNMYVDLQPGSSRAPLGDRPIPASRTDHQVELDQLLTTLSPAAMQGLRSTIRTFGQGTADAPAVARTGRALAPALRSVRDGVAGLRGVAPGDLGRAVAGTSGVVRALDRDEAALGGLIDHGDTTVAVLAARAADLDATLRRAPAALAVSRRELAGLEQTLDRVDPLVADLQPNAGRVAPTVDRLTGALRAATPLLAQAQPLLRRLRPALTALRGAAEQGVPLTRELTPIVDRLNARTLPYLKAPEHDTGRPLYTLIGPLTSEIGDATAVYDHLGHSISFEGGVSGRALNGILPCSPQLTDPDKKLVCGNLNALLAQLMGQPPPQQDPQDTPPAPTTRKGR